MFWRNGGVCHILEARLPYCNCRDFIHKEVLPSLLQCPSLRCLSYMGLCFTALWVFSFLPQGFYLLQDSYILSFSFLLSALSYHWAISGWETGYQPPSQRALSVPWVPRVKNYGQDSAYWCWKHRRPCISNSSESGCKHEQHLHFLRWINVTSKRAAWFLQSIQYIFFSLCFYCENMPLEK